MKLYSTSTSERGKPASKGGNKEMHASFTVERMGERIEVVHVQMLYSEKTKEYKVLVSLPKHQSTEVLLEMNEHSNLYSISDHVRSDQKLTANRNA